MKKIKKDKKKKSQQVGKKVKLNGWLTGLSVFAGVAAISGVTVLGVYLAGGFEEKIFLPESIAFEYATDFYNQEKGQLEIGVSEPFDAQAKQTFKLKITTPTERVTENEVELSFVGQDGFNTSTSEYISNTIIRLPRVVTLNEEFEVELLTENLKENENSSQYVLDEDGNYIDWIKGGISTIRAQSADNQQKPIELTIAVDVPVYQTQTEIVDINGNLLENVVTNQSFYLRSKFIPAKSQYMFSDDKSALAENLWRTKKTFFESKNTTAITPEYDSKYQMHFVVGNEPATDVQINGYTYQTAYSQLNVEKQIVEGSNLDYYISMLENIASTIAPEKVSLTNLTIGEASVGNYTVSKQSQTVEMKVGQGLRLFMNRYASYPNSDYLGVDVYSTSGLLLDGMLKNIAIAFMDGEKDATAGASAVMNVVGGDKAENYITIDGIKYYKPTTAGANIRYSFWDLTPIKEGDVTIKTILMVDNGITVAPFEISGQQVNYNVNLKISEHKELAPTWTSTSDINIMLDYDLNGKVVPQTIDLSSLVNVPATNIYKDVVFFVSFGTQDKLEYVELINKVLGASGYDYEKSGVYATENGNFTFFAVEGNSITLYDTGEFTLYCATVVSNNGQYQLDRDGLYQISSMCGTSIRVISEKSLNDQSVTAGNLNTDNFIAENGEVSINQGSDLTFSVKFTIGKESVPVFEDEYARGFMTPSILDTAKNDISSLLLIDNESFVIDGETGNGTLEYRFKVKSAVQIDSENGVYFGYVALNYSNHDDKDITWEYSLANGQTVCVYKPISTKIEINTEGGYEYENVLLGNDKVVVSQNLTADGSFATNIKVMGGGVEKTYATVNELLEQLVGSGGARVVITDQKQKTNTLSGQWIFKVSDGDGSIINITADGKSFTFKNTNQENAEVRLTITSADNNVSLLDNGRAIAFSVVSTGITHVAYSQTTSTYDTTINDADKTEDISKVAVSKYGAKGESDQFIVLSDLVKFFIADGNDVYSKINFKFNPQYVSESSLSPTQLADLFGKIDDKGKFVEGMLTLYSDDTTIINFNNNYDTANIRSVLHSATIYKLHINKNFALSPTLQFTISDTVGAVNTSFDLNLLANISVSSESYPLAGRTMFAGTEYVIENKVTDNNVGIENATFANYLYTNDTQYWVVYNGERYVLTDVPQQDGAYVATFTQGKIAFVDFWDEETKEFRVYFQPEGNNYFALNHGINFTVVRDLEITSKAGTYYILSDKINTPLEDYVSVTRKSSGGVIPELTLDYTFSDYLTYAGGNVTKKTDVDFYFGYNVQELSSVLTIKLPASNSVLAQVPVKIKLYNTPDLYAKIAENLVAKTTDGVSLSAQTQIVGDVEYLMTDVSNYSSWSLGAIESYYLRPSQKDFYNQNMNSAYEVSGATNLTINFKAQSKLLAGLGDTSKYMVIKVYAEGNTTTLATLHVPLIISMMGYENVVYTDGETTPAQNKRLETALMNPEKLLENKIYNKITAGQLTEILNTYNSGDSTTNGGLYALNKEGFLHTIKYYSFDSTKYENNEALIKGFENSYKTISLNHLAKTYNKDGSLKETFIALEYIVEKSDIGIKQTFYYLVKVVPDIVVEDSVYAYNGDTEYIYGQQNVLVSDKNMEELYGNNTLNDGYKRFNVNKEFYLLGVAGADETIVAKDDISLQINTTKAKVRFEYENDVQIATYDFANLNEFTTQTVEISLSALFGKTLSYQVPVNVMIMEGDVEVVYNDTTIFKTLKYKNEIASVKVGNDDTMYSQEDWEKYIEVYFSADYSTLCYKVKTDNSVEIVVKHTYVGSADADDLAVIDAEQYYKFILNGSASHYTVKFVDNAEEEITDAYVKTLTNGETDEYNLDVLLIENDLAGGSQTGTIIPNLLQIQVISGGEYIADENFEVVTKEDSTTEVNYLKFLNYDNATGEFTLKLKDYLAIDCSVSFAVYTEQGLLATLTFNINANASYSVKKDSTTNVNKDILAGGSTNLFADIFEITAKIDGTTVNDYASVDGRAVGGDVEFVSWKNGGIEVADLIQDKSVTFDFTVAFDDGNKFYFTHTLTLKANIIKISSYASANKTIAGKVHTIELDKLYKFENSAQTDFNTATVLISGSTSSPAVDVNSLRYNNSAWEITTKAVSSTVTVSLNITINIYYGFVSESEYKSLQSYNVVYSFVVEPSVEITNNYPNPTKSQELSFEYVDDGQTFNDVLDNFIGSAPIFNIDKNSDVDGDETRVVIKNGDSAGVYDKVVDLSTLTTETGEGVQENENISIIISDIQNASLSNGDGQHYLVNSALNGKIVFKRGTYSQTSSTYNDNGTDSFVEFTVTYQDVSQTYLVYILKNSLTVQLNYVSNYVSSGEKEGETVNYETVYVDKTNTNNMFAGERMVFAPMSDSMASYSNEYYLVFTDGTNFFSSYPIYLDTADQSKDLYFDMGYSMSGKEFVGAYLTSSFENKGLKIAQNGQIQQGEIKANNTEYTAITQMPTDVANFAGYLFDDGKVTKANRVQLVYGQLEGKDILVDYSWYSSNLATLNVSSTYEIDKISSFSPITTFARGDGSGESETFSVNYNFMPSIDIDVSEKATSAINYVQLEVNQEYISMASLFGVHHPTNKKIISPSDFATGTSALSFRVLGYSNSDTTLPTANDYLSKLGISSTGFKVYADENDKNNTIYLFYAGVENASGNISDYSLIPLGAKNEGDFVLCEIVYTSGEFSKTFYVVAKIVPDYIVKFGDNAENTTIESDGAISNVNNIKLISELVEKNISEEEKVERYADFMLTGETETAGGYLSIKHSNGSSTDVELSATNFNVSMPLSFKYDSTEYNNKENIEEKIFYTSSPNLYDQSANPDGWKLEANVYKKQTKDISVFTDVIPVIFANQYYMIEGEDAYGFKFRLYFILESNETTPSVEGTISLMENGLFDIGVIYQNLSIELDDDTYRINSAQITPASSDSNVTLINIQGIEAWLFNKDYADNTNGDAILQNVTGGGYTTTNKFDNAHVKYLELPKLHDITIEEINIYDPSDISNSLASLTKPAELTGSNGGQFATADVNTAFFNGMTVRGPIPKNTIQDGTETSNVGKLWQVPRLTNTDIFAGTSTADVLLVITLKYLNGEMVEFYDCPVNVSLTRALAINETTNKVTKDAQAIPISDQFYVPFVPEATGGATPVEQDLAKTATFINDTLEVLVSANSTATFDLALSRTGLEKLIEVKGITIPNTGKSFAKTNYISISQYLGINVQAGDTITISNAENAKFYYITEDGQQGFVDVIKTFTFGETLTDELKVTLDAAIDDENNVTAQFDIILQRGDAEVKSESFELTNTETEEKEFSISLSEKFGELLRGDKIIIQKSQVAKFNIDDVSYDITYVLNVGAIEKDYIYIENAGLLSLNSYYDVTKYYVMNCEIGGSNYSYQVSRNYFVTGYYYKMSKLYTTEIGFALQDGDTESEAGYGKIQIEEWKSNAYKLNDATSDNGLIKLGGEQTELDKMKKYIKFSIDESSSTISGMTVGNATITEDGTITLGSSFNENQYVKIALRMVVSGLDRDLNTIETGATYHYLGTLNLALTRV